jgi:hypothetical protein
MHAAEIRIRATRRLGEILRETERARGAADGTPGPGRGRRQNAVEADDTVSTPTLADLGITRDESSRAQRLAGLDPGALERRIAEGRDVSLALARGRGDADRRVSWARSA